MFVEGTITTRHFSLISLYGTQLQYSLFLIYTSWQSHRLRQSSSQVKPQYVAANFCSAPLLTLLYAHRQTDQTRRDLFPLNCKNKHASKNSGFAKHCGSSKGLIRLTWQKGSVYQKNRLEGGRSHTLDHKAVNFHLKLADYAHMNHQHGYSFNTLTHTHTFSSYSVTRLLFTDFLFTKALTELWKCVCVYVWSTFLSPAHWAAPDGQ